MYSGHGLAKGLFIETNMVTCCVKGFSNQSRLNKNVSYHKIPGQERKDISNAWIKAIARPVLPKAIHVCSDHFTEDSYDKSQELKRCLLGGNLKYILEPDGVPSLFPNRKAVNKSVSSNVEESIKLRKVKVSLFEIRMEKMQKGGFFILQYLE